VLRRARAYDLPIYITENGLPDDADDQRPAFIVEHLRRVAGAIEEGIPVRGYYHWALVDNFEWAEGWSLRFGVFALDPETQIRTARPTAALYADIARRNEIP
jgi:beta-glucosidase